jgi:hypothetical protein
VNSKIFEPRLLGLAAIQHLKLLLGRGLTSALQGNTVSAEYFVCPSTLTTASSNAAAAAAAAQTAAAAAAQTAAYLMPKRWR